MQSSSPLASVIVPELDTKTSTSPLEFTTESYSHLIPSDPAQVPEQSFAAEQSSEQRWKRQVEIFTSTFLTIFLAELGDKTQVTTLLMTAESHSPWVVFAGAGSALVLTSLLGVCLGCWLAKRISPRTLELSAGAMLMFISVLLFWDVIRG